MSKEIKKNDKIEYTGRYLVLLPSHGSNGTKSAVGTLNEVGGLSLKSSKEFENEVFTAEDLDGVDGILLDNIGVAIVNKKPAFEHSISALTDNHGMIVEPERVVYAIGMIDDTTGTYLKGYRDAINTLTATLTNNYNEETLGVNPEDASAAAVGATWGLKATNVVPQTFLITNPYSGAGAKVAILDTGFDFQHPDFAGRPIISQSFIAGQTAQDVFGHGTHCVGTSCGPKNPAGNFERYGIAYGAQIYVGKVLANSGSGGDGGILAGINWALGQGCTVISMSLGGAVNGAGFSAVFEATAANVLNQGTLIVAAAGNDSNRPNVIKPVSHPANCPSIMAVGAVDVNLKVASFSNGGLFPAYGAVDIAGPGVGVFSSLSTPHVPQMGAAGLIRGNASGTSMATPHVAGIAALWNQATGLKGKALWNKLLSTAKPLPQFPTRDVGAGLVQSPTKRLILNPIPFPQPIPTPIPGPIPPGPLDSNS